MLDPFETVQSDVITNHGTPKFKWINIVGLGKIGKTNLLQQLREKLLTAYVDCEEGTSLYTGRFLHIRTVDDINKVFTLIQQTALTLPNKKFDAIIIDPLDALVDKIQSRIMRQYNMPELADIKVQGVGNGWSIMYDDFDNIINFCKANSSILLTVTHLKLATHAKGEAYQISKADLDLLGKIKQYVLNKADAHILFSLERGTENKIKVGLSSIDKAIEYDFLGVRNSEMYKAIMAITNPEELKEFIYGQVNS